MVTMNKSSIIILCAIVMLAMTISCSEAAPASPGDLGTRSVSSIEALVEVTNADDDALFDLEVFHPQQ